MKRLLFPPLNVLGILCENKRTIETQFFFFFLDSSIDVYVLMPVLYCLLGGGQNKIFIHLYISGMDIRLVFGNIFFKCNIRKVPPLCGSP